MPTVLNQVHHHHNGKDYVMTYEGAGPAYAPISVYCRTEEREVAKDETLWKPLWEDFFNSPIHWKWDESTT